MKPAPPVMNTRMAQTLWANLPGVGQFCGDIARHLRKFSGSKALIWAWQEVRESIRQGQIGHP